MMTMNDLQFSTFGPRLNLLVSFYDFVVVS